MRWWSTGCGAGIQPEAVGQDSEASDSDPEETGLARFRADVRGRTVGQTASDSGRQRDLARVDDRGGIVEERVAQASEEVHVWRPRRSGFGELVQWDTSDHDWLEGTRAGALSGADDRRCHQLELGPIRRERCNATEHGSAVGVPGEEWPDGGCLHRPRFDVHRSATTVEKARSNSARQTG